MNMRTMIAAGGATLVFAIIALAVSQTVPWQEDNAGGAEDFDDLAQSLFTDHVIALEVLGILLTAALIGALVIARPLGSVDDSSHYAPASMEEEE